MTGATSCESDASRKPFASGQRSTGNEASNVPTPREEKVRLLLLRSESALVAISAPSFVMMTPSNSTSLM